MPAVIRLPFPNSSCRLGRVAIWMPEVKPFAWRVLKVQGGVWPAPAERVKLAGTGHRSHIPRAWFRVDEIGKVGGRELADRWHSRSARSMRDARHSKEVLVFGIQVLLTLGPGC